MHNLVLYRTIFEDTEEDFSFYVERNGPCRIKNWVMSPTENSPRMQFQNELVRNQIESDSHQTEELPEDPKYTLPMVKESRATRVAKRNPPKAKNLLR